MGGVLSPAEGNGRRPHLRLVSPPVRVASSPRRVRIVVVDDHPVLRDVVRLACRDSKDVEVVAEAATGRDALEQCRTHVPDVLVLDLGLPDMSGLEVAARLKSEGSSIRILALSERDDQRAVYECRRLGIEGYFEKTETVSELVDAIRSVATGRQTFSTEHERTAHEQLAVVVQQARETFQVVSSLTPRELEVMKFIAAGFTTRQVATRLSLSERTVESHLAKLYRKLGARTRVQAVVRASKLGLCGTA